MSLARAQDDLRPPHAKPGGAVAATPSDAHSPGVRGPYRVLLLLLSTLAALPAGCSEAPGPPARDAAVAPPAAVDAGPPADLAALEGLTGDVVVVRDGQRVAAKAGALRERDVVETGGAGGAVLRFADGRTVELGPEGRFEVGRQAGGVVVTVEKGLVLSRVPQTPVAGPRVAEVSLTILTPFGLTRVGRAEVKVDVLAESARVAVQVGEVELVSRSGQAVKLGEGKRSTLTASAAPREITIEPVLVLIDAATGKVELKKKDELAWRAVSGKQPPPLTAGDTVRVREGRLELAPKGSDTRVVLQPGTELVIGETKSDGEVDELSLPLTHGAVTLVSGKRTRARVALGDGVVLTSDLDAQVTVTKTADGLEVAPATGFVMVARTGQLPARVLGGQRAALRGAQVEVRDAEKGPFTLPTREGLRVAHPGAEPVTLEWEGEPRGEYLLVVATDAKREQVLVRGLVGQPFFTLTAPAAGALFWTVTKGGATVGQGSARFSPERPHSELLRLKNVVPEGPEKTTIYFQDKPPSVSFTWKPEPGGAASSAVAVYREGALTKPLAERTAPGPATTVSLPVGTLTEGRYVWSVTPLDSKGAPKRGGRMNKLELVWDNVVTSLVISAPENGAPASAAVPVAGIAPVGSSLSVNGRPVSLSAKARFATTVAPLPGGRVVFRLVQGGVESYTVRRLAPRR